MIDPSEKINLLKKIPFFPQLTEESYNLIAEKCKIVHFPPETIIFSQGDVGDYFYLIQSGKVKIVREKEGKKNIIATLPQGEFFGEMALLSGEPRSASAITAQGVICLALSKADFDNILNVTPLLALNLSKAISRRLSMTHLEEKEEEPGKAISIYGVKDRLGKSTFALNLSLYLTKEKKKKVVLLDMDLQFGDIIFMLGGKPERTIFDLVKMKNYDLEAIENHLFSHPSGLKILPSPLKIEDSEIVADKDVLSIITQLKEGYDFVIIDTSSYLTPNIISSLDCSNYILFLITSDISVLKSSKTTLDLMKNLQYQEEKIKIILNATSPTSDLPPDKITELLNKKIERNISYDVSVHQAILKGIPLLDFKPKSQTYLDIVQCANLFEDEKEMKDTSSSKFLSGLFKFGKK